MENESIKTGKAYLQNQDIVQKYSTQGPRYTSYPPVPFWDTSAFSREVWGEELTLSGAEWSKGISLYIHLPYCESLCTFCACHKRITKNHAVEDAYVTTLIKEWGLYLGLMPGKPLVRELHLGGGTPSFFSPTNLEKLIRSILENSDVAEDAAFSFEGHPNNTTFEHLKVLHGLGFRRVSFGVQDYDPKVQQAINRIQPFEHVEEVTRHARDLGYTSVSHDLVFGLPFQTLSSIDHTIKKTLELRPDRIAFYSYAHVPWLKGNGQRGFHDEDLPSPAEKRALYEYGLKKLEEAGYLEVGMDHFALPHDELFGAMEKGELHRNFMGYTTAPSKILIGLGVSSISETPGAFSQNVKDIEVYKAQVENGELPVLKGHRLSAEDRFIKQQILNIMCRFETSWQLSDWTSSQKADLTDKLGDFVNDGLIEYYGSGIRVLEKGRPYVRNISMVFDRYLPSADLQRKMFSMTV